MKELFGFEKLLDEQCQGFKVGEEVVLKKNPLLRTGVIQAFFRSETDANFFKASVRWKFKESGSVGFNYEPLSTLKQNKEG